MFLSASPVSLWQSSDIRIQILDDEVLKKNTVFLGLHSGFQAPAWKPFLLQLKCFQFRGSGGFHLGPAVTLLLTAKRAPPTPRLRRIEKDAKRVGSEQNEQENHRSCHLDSFDKLRTGCVDLCGSMMQAWRVDLCLFSSLVV
jgi:hypothetical protein